MLSSEMVVCEGNTDLPGSLRRIACDRNVASLPVTDTAAQEQNYELWNRMDFAIKFHFYHNTEL